jgi:hypothetical protein
MRDSPLVGAEIRPSFVPWAALPRAERRLHSRLLAVAIGIALATALAYSFGTVLLRPLDIVEGEILFEASRIRDKLPLYVDPLQGTHDYGPVPSRYYVLYTPLWPFLLAQLPAGLAPTLARLASGLAWFGLLTRMVLLAAPQRRYAVLVGAACAGGTFMLARNAAIAGADAVAVSVAGVALVRSARGARADALSGALFAVAAWAKPNVIGLAAGALLYEVVVGRRRAAGALLGAAVVSAAFGFWSNRVSGGAWVEHLARSTMQPIDPLRAVALTVSRFPLLGLPHGFVAYCGWRARSSPNVRLVLSALASSLLWTLLSVGKVGSSTNYWMEPTVAAVLLLGYAPVPDRLPAGQPGIRAALALVCFGALAVNAAGSLVALSTAVKRGAAVRRVRATCGAAPEDLVLGEHPGYEVMLNGRLLETPYQMTHLARSGRYPVDLWKTDIGASQIRCLVMESDLLERPLSDVNVADDRFGVEIRAALKRRFELVAQDSGLWIYRARKARQAE